MKEDGNSSKGVDQKRDPFKIAIHDVVRDASRKLDNGASMLVRISGLSQGDLELMRLDLTAELYHEVNVLGIKDDVRISHLTRLKERFHEAELAYSRGRTARINVSGIDMTFLTQILEPGSISLGLLESQKKDMKKIIGKMKKEYDKSWKKKMGEEIGPRAVLQRAKNKVGKILKRD